VREYLAALDQAMATEAAKTDNTNNEMPPGNPPAGPKVTSLTDPAPAWTNKGQMKVGFTYGTNYLIDTQRAIIVDSQSDAGAVERRGCRHQDDAAEKPRVLWPQAAAIDAGEGVWQAQGVGSAGDFCKGSGAVFEAPAFVAGVDDLAV
jgi:hypothetical protein